MDSADFLMTTGCSFGAYHAANLAFKHPEVFSRVIAISGEYEAGVLQGQPVQFMAKPFDLQTLLDMIGGKPN